MSRIFGVCKKCGEEKLLDPDCYHWWCQECHINNCLSSTGCLRPNWIAIDRTETHSTSSVRFGLNDVDIMWIAFMPAIVATPFHGIKLYLLVKHTSDNCWRIYAGTQGSRKIPAQFKEIAKTQTCFDGPPMTYVDEVVASHRRREQQICL